MTYGDIMEELKGAMRAGETEKRDTLRLLQSALKNYAIDARTPAEELASAEVEGVIKKLVKQRKDSIAQFQAGGRADLAEQEEKEMAILAAYLPAEMSDEDLMKIIKSAISEGGFSSKADLGKATGAVMKLVGGAASGDRVREMLAGELE